MDAPTYANAAQLAAAKDIPITPAAEAGMLRHLDAASRQIEGWVGGRHFYPTLAARTFDYPHPTGRGTARRLWLDDDELVSLTSITVAGTVWTSSQYRLQPNDGPPFRWIEPSDASTAQSFTAGQNGSQDAVSLVGWFGHGETLTARATLSAAIGSTTSTTVTVSDGTHLGAGAAIKIDDEYLLISSTGFVDTAENLGAALTLDHEDQTIAVADGTTYSAGEVLRVDTERMLVVDIIGNTLYVDRGADGSYMAAHSLGADIYARRSLTVERGKLGTTAATHADATSVQLLSYPSVVETVAIGQAMTTIAQEGAAWARMVGSGESEREARGASLQGYIKSMKLQYGQRHRAQGVGAQQ